MYVSAALDEGANQRKFESMRKRENVGVAF
jgi:hypothetical protein